MICVLPVLSRSKLVLGVLVLELRLHEAVSPVHRQADGWRQVQAVAVGAGQAVNVGVQTRSYGIAILVDEVAVFQVAIKPHELRSRSEIQTARMVRQLTIEGDLRQTIVRRDVRDGRQLVRLSIQACGVGVAAISHGALLVDVVAGS